MAKSPNKHNKFYISAEPMTEDELHVCEASDDLKVIAKSLKEPTLWSFKQKDINLLIDTCTTKRGVWFSQYFDKKDSVINGFKMATTEGSLIEETVRGVKYKILDITYVRDAVHRGDGQIIPTVRRVCNGAQLSAAPKLLHPIFQANIEIKENLIGDLYDLINVCKGHVFQEITKAHLCCIQAILPLHEHTPSIPNKIHRAILKLQDFDKFEDIIIENGGSCELQFHHWEYNREIHYKMQ